MNVHARFRNEQHRKSDLDIHVGEATICAGGIYDENRRWVRGWHLPGGGFTTSKVRAKAVAEEIAALLQRVGA